MKASMLMKNVAALAVGAAFPLGAIAAQPAKTIRFDPSALVHFLHG
jgi:hypothetical protein